MGLDDDGGVEVDACLLGKALALQDVRGHVGLGEVQLQGQGRRQHGAQAAAERHPGDALRAAWHVEQLWKCRTAVSTQLRQHGMFCSELQQHAQLTAAGQADKACCGTGQMAACSWGGGTGCHAHLNVGSNLVQVEETSAGIIWPVHDCNVGPVSRRHYMGGQLDTLQQPLLPCAHHGGHDGVATKPARAQAQARLPASMLQST